MPSLVPLMVMDEHNLPPETLTASALGLCRSVLGRGWIESAREVGQVSTQTKELMP